MESFLELDFLFKPSSVAVVGASRDRGKLGNVILRNLLSTYDSKIFAVNRNTDIVEGLSAHESMKHIGSPVDLMIVAVPREFVPEVMEDAVASGTRSAIIVTSGFRELDDDGARLEEEVLRIARRGGLRFLGPNTLGVITPSLNATFALADVKRGPLALVAQSGGVGVYMLNWANKTRTGISYFISLGNEADVSESEVYSYLVEDVDTQSIFSYNEGVKDGRRFLECLPGITSRKPVVFLKGGVGREGAAAVRTHTGSLAGSSEIFRAAVRTVGGIYVENLEEFLDIAKIVRMKDVVRKDILIVTNSGGHGVLATDEVARQGLHLVDLPSEVQDELRRVLPSRLLLRNPLDLSGDADKVRYEKVLKIVGPMDCTKLVMLQSIPIISCSELARVLVDYNESGVVAVLMGMDEDSAIRILESGGVPAFRFPEDAVKSITHICDSGRHRPKVQIARPITAAERVVKGKEKLSDKDTFELLQIYGFCTPRWRIAKTVQEAQKISDEIGYPVVMKIAPGEPVHKTDLGGVLMNVEKQDVEQGYSRLSKITPDVMVQEQLSGAEVFLGGIDDPTFGKAVVVGLGGIYVEVMKSVSYGLCPVTHDEALEMLTRSRVHDLLVARKRGYNEASVVQAVTTLSRMMVDLDLKQVDMNPVIVNDKDSFVVDARLLI